MIKNFTEDDMRTIARQALHDADSLIVIDHEDGYVYIREDDFNDWFEQIMEKENLWDAYLEDLDKDLKKEIDEKGDINI